MKRSLCVWAVLCGLALPAVASAAAVTLNESYDYGGSEWNWTAYTDLGAIDYSPLTIHGSLNGLAGDIVDAWRLTIPEGRTLTGINVTYSTSNGNQNYFDFFSDPNANPLIHVGDLFSSLLYVREIPLSVGPGTYKLSAQSGNATSYTIQILSEANAAAVPEPSAAALGLLAAGLLVRRRRARAC